MAIKPSLEMTGMLYNFLMGSDVIAAGVSFEDFLEADYGEGHFEWYAGYVIKMPGIDERHNALNVFLILLFSAFLERIGGGRVMHDPMLVRLAQDLPARSPDIQVLLPEHKHYIRGNYVAVAPDLIVEIISPGSDRTDRIAKYTEYEKAGVSEYWLLDHRFEDAQFFQLNANGEYVRIAPDDAGIYQSRALPKLTLPVALLWRAQLPSVVETLELVQTMLNEDKL